MNDMKLFVLLLIEVIGGVDGEPENAFILILVLFYPSNFLKVQG